MKKKYLKPDAEYISLEATNIITGPIDGDMGDEDVGDLGDLSALLD